MAASYFLLPNGLLLTKDVDANFPLLLLVCFEPCTNLMRLRFWPVGLASVVADENNAEVDRFLFLPT